MRAWYRSGVRRSVGKVVARVRRSLSPELLTPAERRRRRSHPVAGHCAVASEATYHLLGGARSGYVPFVASWIERGQRRTHWWLVRRRDGHVVDPTAEQFSARKRALIYSRGRACGFSTPKRGRRSQPPSKRAQVVMRRVLQKNVNARAFGTRIRRAIETDEAYGILDSIGDERSSGGTWLAGGCAFLARALVRKSHGALKLAYVIDDRGRTHHVVAYDPLHDIYYDGDGASRRTTLETRWRTVEGVPGAHVVHERPRGVGRAVCIGTRRSVDTLMKLLPEYK